MSILELKEYIDTGREIEFIYNDIKYSITYYSDNRINYISFCEFYKEPIDVKDIDELLSIDVNGIKLDKIILIMSSIKCSFGDADIFLDHFYLIIPRDLRYSIGLNPPRDTLILLLAYHSI